MQGWLRELGEHILPMRCILCGRISHERQELCKSCITSLEPFPEPFCDVCGAHLGIQNQCLSCIRQTPPYDIMRGIFLYEGALKTVIHRFKYGRCTYLKNFLGKNLACWLAHNPIQFDLITCVPMHWTKLVYRGYNQSALLAREVARRSGLEYKPGTIKKIRSTKAQAGLDKKNRNRNMKRAFTASKVHGRAVLVIDDVITTGQTAFEVCLALRQAGACRIGFLSAGRVL